MIRNPSLPLPGTLKFPEQARGLLDENPRKWIPVEYTNPTSRYRIVIDDADPFARIPILIDPIHIEKDISKSLVCDSENKGRTRIENHWTYHDQQTTTTGILTFLKSRVLSVAFQALPPIYMRDLIPSPSRWFVEQATDPSMQIAIHRLLRLISYAQQVFGIAS
jgi:hypothetical protein